MKRNRAIILAENGSILFEILIAIILFSLSLLLLVDYYQHSIQRQMKLQDNQQQLRWMTQQLDHYSQCGCWDIELEKPAHWHVIYQRHRFVTTELTAQCFLGTLGITAYYHAEHRLSRLYCVQ